MLTELSAAIGEPTVDALCRLPYKEAKGQMVERFELKYLLELCRRFGDNLSAASRESGLSRRHLRALYRKHGLRNKEADANPDFD
jgi:hypothetical protein